MITRRDILTASAGFAISATYGATPALAQPRTLHILTTSTPGLLDAMARLLADQMGGYAATIVVESRPGAAGRIAVEAVKTAEPDGSVMLFAPLGFMMLFPHIYKALRYQPRDFTPVSTVGSAPAFLTVGPKVPTDVRTVADFVAWCRANPQLATYGTPGVGTTLHFLGMMLGRSAGFEFLHVPYQGVGAIYDLAKGVIAAALMPIGSSLGLVQSGDLRALATTGPRRSQFAPAVPTVREVGYPALEDLTWFGFFVPAKTAPSIVAKLNAAIQAALSTNEVRAGMEKLAVDPQTIAMGDFVQLIASESDRWKAIVQETGFVPAD
ncbi:tripartite tricarboxylate transporter substrate binding protein [Bradyrhizobium sp. KB893862 SZCCT0404]|uniref:Bug family tripartite tricarboxylate transporter substrate binding protein n=1 Tax=Bradyrhizobium sp. KB893862 SZCCT0404 TaxID=2807672 RepID=UPI001BA9C3CC|nr:tripartite tricarboxylate transporter substrate binding protein [Bradyrhizobium sp. KB893862 SZCCT0404]MBR1178520.1 tripartite tricarboxylate transporter substrate binding protein [Bradyrhizobium sp. KB893862 SZCCT0404]